jgi:hypothetical protein
MGLTNGNPVDINDITGVVSLPTGASTETKQDAGNTSLSSIDGKIITVDTDNVTVIGSSLPTGAATEAKQDTGNGTLASIDSKFNTLGQKASAASVPVVIASDQSALQLKPNGGSFTDHSGTVGTTSTQIMPVNADRKYLLIQNNSGKTLWINFTATATAASPSIAIAANGGSLVMEGNFVSTEAINAISTSAAQAFTAKQG